MPQVQTSSEIKDHVNIALEEQARQKDQLLSIMKKAALSAGAAIMQVYDSMDFAIEYKADESPLTKADKVAHEIIKSELAVTGLPLLSEEGSMTPYEERKHWASFWLVDPLDGTKEFIGRTREFTVNIALIENRKPLLGVVFAPALHTLYWNDSAGKAWKQKKGCPAQTIHTQPTDTIRCIVASKRHLTPETEMFIGKYPEAELQTIGSSLKFMLVAEGAADCYPRFGPTSEWDTAAAQAIVEAAGGKVVRYDGEEALHYNKENLLNPWFIVKA